MSKTNRILKTSECCYVVVSTIVKSKDSTENWNKFPCNCRLEHGCHEGLAVRGDQNIVMNIFITNYRYLYDKILLLRAVKSSTNSALEYHFQPMRNIEVKCSVKAVLYSWTSFSSRLHHFETVFEESLQLHTSNQKETFPLCMMKC